ncbi:MAG TPA: hypothetical protein VF215_02045 [Thermoanaerobaculia bacterium]
MSGRIIGISGPTVSVDLRGLKLHERVIVGHARLMGEVVRLERERATVQVYESTRGLGLHEPVEGTSTGLTASLGPGLLGEMFDGLQRPLKQLRQEYGPFLRAGGETATASIARPVRFVPLKKQGEESSPASPPVTSRRDRSGTSSSR